MTSPQIEDFERRSEALEDKLRPIATRTSRPGAAASDPSPCNPLDAAGVRSEADRWVDEVIAFYATADADDREAVRALMHRHKCLRWAAGWGRLAADAPLTLDRLRLALLLFSIKDQGADPRDAIMALDRLCARAVHAALPIAEMLADVAALSSDDNRFEMVRGRSTRAMLLAYSTRFGGGSDADRTQP